LAARPTIAPRLGAGILRHSRKALAATSAAKLASVRVESGVSPSTSSVLAGLMFGTRLLDVEAIHSPPMKFW